MADMMTFPETWEEFEKSYGFVDDEEIYTNGSRLIPSFRVKQWLDHIAQPNLQPTCNQLATDTISRQDAVDALCGRCDLVAEDDEPCTEKCNDIKILENLPSAQPKSKQESKQQATVSSDCISRQGICDWLNEMEKYGRKEDAHGYHNTCAYIAQLPPTQLDRDIPLKPVETTDKAWGIPVKQAVCPKCDYYLGHIAFLGDYKGKRITYCETCGQAIDWEGWDFDD